MRNVTNCAAQKGPFVQRGLAAKLTGGLSHPFRFCGEHLFIRGRLGARLLTLLLLFTLVFSFVLPLYAADGKVTYSGNAGDFVFEPGSVHSLTDLFPDFKDVMPGDTLTQQITVKNEADNKVKVKIYVRSLGAHEDSEKFLSQLGLKVQKSEENTMAYMFDAAASQSAQLTDWVCLGTLYSGGEVNLDVTLDVPTALGNEFQNAIGSLDWEFKVEEYPIDDTDPTPPPTGDSGVVVLCAVIMLCSLFLIIVLFVRRKKDKENEGDAVKH